MKNRRQRFAAIGQLDPFDVMVGKRRIFVECCAFLVVQARELLVDFVDGPHRRSPVIGGHEIVVARRSLVAGLLGRLGRPFAFAGQRFESRADIDQPLHAFAQFVHVRRRARSEAAQGGGGAALIPVDAVRLDDVIEHPTLLVEALDHRLAFRPAVRPVARVRGGAGAGARRLGCGGRDDVCDCRAGGGRQRAGLQECTTIHDAPPKIDVVASVAVAALFSASIIGAGRGSLKRHFGHA